LPLGRRSRDTRVEVRSKVRITLAGEESDESRLTTYAPEFYYARAHRGSWLNCGGDFHLTVRTPPKPDLRWSDGLS
jgi:hypothetical protein